ncbi:MAG TPA: hemin uptake protein HemP [Xanthobacteraceae bacterium]|nr:hemin uptake protein HemP [Xanthobacteraceae bacterium]
MSNASDDDKADTRTITIIGDRVSSRELFASSRQITIEHGGDLYSLRLTAQNKLILTK